MGQNKRTSARPKPTLPAGAPHVHLTVIADRAAAAAETTQPVTLIGSRRDCDLFVGHSDVSKVHCALVNTGTTIVVTDLCTRSGTFVNGQQVSAATLRPGDELRVGSEPIGVQFRDSAGDSGSPPIHENDADLDLRPPLQLDGADQSYELATLPAVIGRRSACQVVLDTPDVSLAHALLFAIKGQPAVCDLGSRSGTHLNGERVALAWLCDGDRLNIGGEELSLSWSGRESAPSGADLGDAPNDHTAEANVAGPASPPDPGLLHTAGEGLKPGHGSWHVIMRERFAALEQREAELAAAEHELARKQAELAKREAADDEAAKQIAQLVGALSEAWLVFGFGGAPAAQDAEPSSPPALSTQPETGLGDPDHGGTAGLSASAGLPAPLVNNALFPNP